jgi:hypothetical protein
VLFNAELQYFNQPKMFLYTANHEMIAKDNRIFELPSGKQKSAARRTAHFYYSCIF